MSKITISILNPVASPPVIKAIRDIIGGSYKDLAEALKPGGSTPFYRAELFLNDHPERDRQVRGIIETLKKTNWSLLSWRSHMTSHLTK